MIWNLMFWLGIAYLAMAVIWRFFVPAFARSKRPVIRTPDTETTRAERVFARGWLFPSIAVGLVALAFVARANPGLFASGWSVEEKAQLEYFTSAMDLYDQATEIAAARKLQPEDWESIKALLEASLSEAEQVSDRVLRRLDGGATEHYHNEFLQGLRTGVFGLAQYVQGAPKGTDTLRYHGADSLKIGRELLAKWDAWYLPRRAAILIKIEGTGETE